jgi:ABC-2 type transport system ATP-binding protein
VIKKQGQEKTILFSSHILQEVEAICDRVIIIHKGEIAADDSLGNLQKSKNDFQTVIVEFKETIDKQILENIKEASVINQTSAFNFKISTANSEFVRKQILELALQHNLNIVSLHSKNRSLEEVFKSLTGKAE